MRQDRKNRNIAFAYFQAIGLIPKNAGKNEWHLHHKDLNLKTTDKARYDEWRVEDLVPMLARCHRVLHNKGRKLSDETKAKLSDSLKGHEMPESTRRKISDSMRASEAFHDWVASEEHRKEVSEQMKKRWAEAPRCRKVRQPKPISERCRLWINDGQANRRIREGDPVPKGWKRGKLGFKRKHSPRLGKMSDEHRRKISEARKGMKFSDEHREHLSESHRRGRGD